MQVAVVLAGGSGKRSGADGNKVLAQLGGVPILRRSVEAMIAGGAEAVVVVVRPVDHDEVAIALAGIAHVMVAGGTTRQGSEVAGLAAAAALGATESTDVIAIHDGARPLVSADLVAAVFVEAKGGAAWPALRDDNVWAVDGATLVGQIAAQLAQTPQAGRADVLHRAYAAAARAGLEATDTIAVVQSVGLVDIVAVPGEASNIKVTWPEDFAQAETILAHGIAPLTSTVVDQDSALDPADEGSPAAAEPELDLAALEAAESELDDIEAAMRCVAIEGTAHDPVCTAALANGTLADRPALARCVAAKQD